ncbi:MAG: phosphodiesterase [Ruminococcaceae bacterium]|nr:phosphodiesterase [Oscillospiraceae bacterium]
MKVLIASDIHGSAYYCQKLLERIQSEQPDKIFLLGDILYHGPRNDLPRDYAPKQVIAMLNPLKEKIVAVRGNCEAEVDQMVLDFDVTATYKEVEVNGMHLVLTHGHHYNKERPFALRERYVLLNGHFHVPELTDMGDFIYINCGSVSIPKENSPHAYVMLEGNTFLLKDLETAGVFGRLDK